MKRISNQPTSLCLSLQSKIVRVLNLWQKNAVFKSDIIQPLLDMAAGLPPPSVTPVMASSTAPANNATPGQSGRAHDNGLLTAHLRVDGLMFSM